MKYKYILFDMDGTVLDTLTDLTNAVNYSLEQFSLPLRTDREIRSFLGSGARQLIKSSAPADYDAALFEELLAFYKEWYDSHCIIETAPYPGMLELMERLRREGCKLAIISNKPHSAVAELAEHFFPGLLELAIGEKAPLRPKPWPDMVLHAVELLSADKHDCLYVGDSEQDIQTAANAGMDCASVTWGFRDAQHLKDKGGKCLVSTMEELYKLIKG